MLPNQPLQLTGFAPQLSGKTFILRAFANRDLKSSQLAGEILRGMVDRIEITPAPNTTGNSGGDDPVPDAESSPQPSGIAVILYGELAAVIGLAEENETIDSKRGFSLSAGACNHRELTLPAVII